MAAEFVKVGKLSDFPEGRGRSVRLDGTRVAIFKSGGTLRALQDACPHMGASLADGRLEAGRVICHWHGWTFDLETGQGDRRAWACARSYEVKVEGGEVYLRRPAEPQKPPPEPGDDWVAWDPNKHLRPEGGEDGSGEG